MQSILPYILRDLPTICCEECTGADVRKFELQSIQQLAVMIKQLIYTTDWMTRLANPKHLFIWGGIQSVFDNLMHIIDDRKTLNLWFLPQLEVFLCLGGRVVWLEPL